MIISAWSFVPQLRTLNLFVLCFLGCSWHSATFTFCNIYVQKIFSNIYVQKHQHFSILLLQTVFQGSQSPMLLKYGHSKGQRVLDRRKLSLSMTLQHQFVSSGNCAKVLRLAIGSFCLLETLLSLPPLKQPTHHQLKSSNNNFSENSQLV